MFEYCVPYLSHLSHSEYAKFLLHSAQTVYGVNLTSYSMGTWSVVKQPKCETGHSLPSGAKVKNGWCYIAISPYAFMARTGTTSPLPHGTSKKV